MVIIKDQLLVTLIKGSAEWSNSNNNHRNSDYVHLQYYLNSFKAVVSSGAFSTVCKASLGQLSLYWVYAFSKCKSAASPAFLGLQSTASASLKLWSWRKHTTLQWNAFCSLGAIWRTKNYKNSYYIFTVALPWYKVKNSFHRRYFLLQTNSGTYLYINYLLSVD